MANQHMEKELIPTASRITGTYLTHSLQTLPLTTWQSTRNWCHLKSVPVYFL